MPTFTYVARDHRGTVQTGQLDALEEDDVVTILQHRGLLVTLVLKKDVSERVTFARRGMSYTMHARVTLEDQVVLCQQLATLVGAGVPLLRGIEVVSAQSESRALVVILREVCRDVEGGRTFRDALARHPAVFSKLWLTLVETGEASGHLANSLQQLGRQLQLTQHLRTQAKTALTYPAFLIAMAIGVVGVFVYWLIPKFSVMFISMGMDLPPLTRLTVAVSEAARRYAVAMVFVAGALGALMRRYLRTEPGRWCADRLLLRLPLFGTLASYVQLAEFSRGLSTLLEGGVPLLSTLEILESSTTNTVYGQAVAWVRQHVKEGKTMAEPMQHTGLFPPLAVQMIQVGEEVGELAKMAGRIAEHYEERVSTFVERMTRLFEPIAIVIMGGLVLVIVLSIFLPIFQMAGGKLNLH